MARPWILTAVVFLVVGLPLLAFGELAARDTEERARADQITLTAQAAAHAADLASAPIRAVRDVLVEMSASGSARGLRMQETNAAVIAEVLVLYRPLLGRDVTRMGFFMEETYVSDRLDGGISARTFAEETNRRFQREGNTGARARTAYSRPYAAESGRGTAITVAATSLAFLPSGQLAGGGLRTFVAEIELTNIGQVFAPLLTPGSDVYFLDQDGRLIGRAAGTDTATLRTVGDVPPAGSAGFYADPLGRATRLLAVVTVPQLGSVVVVRSATAVEEAIRPVLDQARFFRVMLVALLLAASYVLARGASQIARSRRSIADALDRNTELVIQLRESNGALEQATAAKSKFLATMSHELRTPLNAIIGFSDVLLMGAFGAINGKQREYLDDIRSSGAHQLALINDMLDLSKVEAGRLELETTPVSVGDILASSVALLRERAAHRGLSLKLTVDSDLPLIAADGRKVLQIAVNLLSNAIKFTPEGGRVTASVSRGDTEVLVSVADTGPGIDADDQARLFREFEQTRTGRAEQEGTGLGLALSKKLVELHGGRIWVESEPGGGATFRFTLPVQNSPTLITG